jgi:DNA-binding GntR family transcriptional regulator
MAQFASRDSAILVAASATPVRAQLARRLRALITEGTYKPGDRLIERELCERLKVSRPSIRETLRQLEAEGLIDIIPNRGPVVRMIDATEVLELWEVRLSMECLIARRFAIHGSAEDADDLERCIHALDHALKAQDRARIKAAKNAYFESFAAGAHNEALAGYFRQLTVRLSFLWTSSLMIPGRPAESIGEQLALLAAIRARNPDAAQAAVVLHNEHAKAIGMYGLRVFEESRRQSAAAK